MKEDPRQQWGTPRPIFDTLYSEYAFDVDAAASKNNALLLRYWTHRNSGLDMLDESDARAFVNPPYAYIPPWIESCFLRCEDRGAFSAMLLPNRTDQRWFHSFARQGEVHFFRGRIQFREPRKVKASSNREGSILVVFDADTLGQNIVRYRDNKTGEYIR